MSPFALLVISSVVITTLVVLFPRKDSFYSEQPDALSMTYLRAILQFWPDDHEARLRLARQLNTLGRTSEALTTIEPEITLPGPQGKQARLLALDLRLGQLHALHEGDSRRQTALRAVDELLEKVLQDDLSAAELERIAELSLSPGRPGLAVKIYTRLAEKKDAARRSAWLGKAARWALANRQPAQAGHLYHQASEASEASEQAFSYALQSLDALRAANQGKAALQRLHDYLRRFPKHPELLRRGMALALAQNEALQARDFGRQLLALTPNDTNIIARQLDMELAAGSVTSDPDHVLTLAQRLVHLAPQHAPHRQRLAQIAEWTKHPALALPQWAWLAHHNPQGPALDHALQLARGLHDNQTLIDMLALRNRSGTLSQDEAAALAFAYEQEGKPEAAIAFLRGHLARYPAQRPAWERLAGLQERSGDPRTAIETWREISRRFGLTVSEALQLAALLWRTQHPGEALTLLRDSQNKAGEKDTAFWQRMGELAWQQEADADALHAYRMLWKTAPDTLVAERLMHLEREAKHTDEALTVATSAWQRFRQPRFLLFALDTANQDHRQDKLTELFKLADQAQDVFASSENYWLLRAQFAADQKRYDETASAWRQVLRLNPQSSQARAGLLWLFIDHDKPGELGRALAHWQNDAAKDESLWPAYAAGLHKLGRLNEALPWYARQARAHPQDKAWLRSYADALEQAGQADAAWRLRHHAQDKGANGNIKVTEDTPPPRPRTVGFPNPVPGILGLEWRRHNIGALDIDRIDAMAMMNRKQWGAELQLGRRELSAPSQQLALAGRNQEVDIAIAGKYRWQEAQTELRLGVNQRDDRNLPYARLSLDSILRDDTSGRLSLSLNELSEESAALRAGGARHRIGMTLFSNLTRREYLSTTLGWQRYHDRAGASLGTGYGLDMELGHRLWLGTPEWRLRLQGSWVDNQLNSALPPGLAAVLPPGAGIGSVLPDRYATLGLGTTLQRGEPGSPLSPPLSPAYLFDVWAGGLWPAQRLAYSLRMGAGMPVFGRDELSLNAFYANTQGGLPGQAWQGFALRYNRRFDW